MKKTIKEEQSRNENTTARQSLNCREPIVSRSLCVHALHDHFGVPLPSPVVGRHAAAVCLILELHHRRRNNNNRCVCVCSLCLSLLFARPLSRLLLIDESELISILLCKCVFSLFILSCVLLTVLITLFFFAAAAAAFVLSSPPSFCISSSPSSSQKYGTKNSLIKRPHEVKIKVNDEHFALWAIVSLHIFRKWSLTAPLMLSFIYWAPTSAEGMSERSTVDDIHIHKTIAIEMGRRGGRVSDKRYWISRHHHKSQLVNSANWKSWRKCNALWFTATI